MGNLRSNIYLYLDLIVLTSICWMLELVYSNKNTGISVIYYFLRAISYGITRQKSIGGKNLSLRFWLFYRFQKGIFQFLFFLYPVFVCETLSMHLFSFKKCIVHIWNTKAAHKLFKTYWIIFILFVILYYFLSARVWRNWHLICLYFFK